MTCPLVHTRATGEKEKTEIKIPDGKAADGNYIKWFVDKHHDY
jgi:hypothetical protein